MEITTSAAYWHGAVVVRPRAFQVTVPPVQIVLGGALSGAQGIGTLGSTDDMGTSPRGIPV